MLTALVLLGTTCALPAASEIRRIAITLRDGLAHGADLNHTRSGRAPTLVLVQGQEIEIAWSSDRAMDLHLHGYGIEITVAPGRPVTMAFLARAAGRFAVETHRPDGRHQAVLYIEIHPR